MNVFVLRNTEIIGTGVKILLNQKRILYIIRILNE